jgi:hypothetical protein
VAYRHPAGYQEHADRRLSYLILLAGELILIGSELLYAAPYDGGAPGLVLMPQSMQCDARTPGPLRLTGCSSLCRHTES